MERKTKREFARKVANIESKIQRAKTQEERASAEQEMESEILAFMDREDFSPDIMEYVDSYIINKLGTSQQIDIPKK